MSRIVDEHFLKQLFIFSSAHPLILNLIQDRYMMIINKLKIKGLFSIKFLTDIEKNELKHAMTDLLKIAFFIGFVPSIGALLIDLSSGIKNLNGFNEMMEALIPTNSIYMTILVIYSICHMLCLYVLGFCVHFNKKIFPRFLSFCEFFSPVAEVLLQVLAVISGLLFALTSLMLLSTNPSHSIIFGVMTFFLFFLSVIALTINRVITIKYKNL